MKTIIIYLFLAFTTLGQNFRDTIYVTAFQEFKIPRKEPAELLYPVRGVSYKAKLMDSNQNLIRECTKFVQFPAKEDAQRMLPPDGRGILITVWLFETLKKAGEYILQLDYNITLETGGSGNTNRQRLYKVIVKNPTLVNPTGMKSSYYFQENKSFSFATREFADANLYSYKIESGGNVIIESKGSYVSLDTILNDKKYVGREVKITGLYDGEVFDFTEPGSEEVKKSGWVFTIKPPQSIVKRYNWTQIKTKEIYVDPMNNLNRNFEFAFISSVADKYIISPAENDGNIQVIADPPDFLEGKEIVKDQFFMKIVIVPSQTFLDEIPACESEDVSITIRYNTSFPGISVNETFYAKIIK